MILRSRPPAPSLRGFVDRYWYLSGYQPDHARERALPTGTLDIVINLGGEQMRVFRNDDDREGFRFTDSVVCGPQSGYFVLDMSRPGPVAGVHFRPGGAAPFLGIAASELTDMHAALDDVWGSWTGSVRDRLLEATSIDSIFDILERMLIARLKRPLLLHPAVATALEELNAASRIREVQTQTGCSPKRFIGLFREAVGITPKRYCRIRRFQDVIAQIARGGQIDWADVAAANGYFDQPHLTREFRDFAGVTPSNYRPVSRQRPSHVAAE